MLTLRKLYARIPANCHYTKIKGSNNSMFVLSAPMQRSVYISIVDSSARSHVSGDILIRSARDKFDYSGKASYRNEYVSIDELSDAIIRITSDERNYRNV